MAKITARPQLDIEIHFTVNEAEARALDALAGYGDDPFIKMFKEKLGSHYIEPYEAGMRSFLKSIRGEVAEPLRKLDEARRSFNSK